MARRQVHIPVFTVSIRIEPLNVLCRGSWERLLYTKWHLSKRKYPRLLAIAEIMNPFNHAQVLTLDVATSTRTASLAAHGLGTGRLHIVPQRPLQVGGPGQGVHFARHANGPWSVNVIILTV